MFYYRNKRQKVDALEFAGDKHELIDYQGLGQTPGQIFLLVIFIFLTYVHCVRLWCFIVTDD